MARAAGCALLLMVASGALSAPIARADDPTPPPPADPPAVTLPAEPDPAPDPSPARSAPNSRPARSTHSQAAPSTSSARAAQHARLPAPTLKKTQLERPALRSLVGRPKPGQALRLKRRRAGRQEPRAAAPAPQIPARPTHERPAVGRLQPLAARSGGPPADGARTPLLITTAALLVGLLGLFALRMLSPHLVTATRLPTRSPHSARARRRQTGSPRTRARPAARVAPAPPATAAPPVLPQRAAEPPRAAAPETPERGCEPPSSNESPARREQALATTCEIRVFRGYVKSQFYAAVMPSGGQTPFAVGQSGWFRWRQTDTQTPRPDIVGARDQLLKVLGADGWVRIGQGAEWYSDRLERKVRAR